MPDPTRTFRAPPNEWVAFLKRTAAAGRTMTDVLRVAVRAYAALPRDDERRIRARALAEDRDEAEVIVDLLRRGLEAEPSSEG